MTDNYTNSLIDKLKLEKLASTGCTGHRFYAKGLEYAIEVIRQHEALLPDKETALKRVRDVLDKYYPDEAARLYEIFTGYVMTVYEGVPERKQVCESVGSTPTTPATDALIGSTENEGR